MIALRRAFRIHADTDTDAGMFPDGSVVFELREGVKADVIAKSAEPDKFLIGKSRRKDMRLLAEFSSADIPKSSDRARSRKTLSAQAGCDSRSPSQRDAKAPDCSGALPHQ